MHYFEFLLAYALILLAWVSTINVHFTIICNRDKTNASVDRQTTNGSGLSRYEMKIHFCWGYLPVLHAVIMFVSRCHFGDEKGEWDVHYLWYCCNFYPKPRHATRRNAHSIAAKCNFVARFLFLSLSPRASAWMVGCKVTLAPLRMHVN